MRILSVVTGTIRAVISRLWGRSPVSGDGMEEIEQLKKELEKQTRQAEERLEQLKYLQADFDNFRKWYVKEKEVITSLANENLIHDLLVILDDFERALPEIEQEKNKEGMEMVYKKFKKILSDYGLEPIESVGKKFDPHFHEALCKEQCGEKSGTVLEDLGKGYRLRSKVIRPSRVKIAEQVTGEKGE
jgi:molecular chaperone GrpE